MARIWRVFSRSNKEKYDFARLIDRVGREDPNLRTSNIQVICDIDKTYLETEFESFFKMARVAFESAEAKITVQGASDVLLATRWGDPKASASDGDFPRGLHFVSSSPPQLRAVLEQKLSLDGLDWSSDTFKNQAYNVLKGRMDLLKQHVGYKSAAILQLISTEPEGQKYYLIGDNAESDAFIYTGVAMRLAGVLDPESYARYLEAAGIETAVAEEISKNFESLPRSRVHGIFIRNAPGYNFVDCAPLTTLVNHFDDFFQAALLLIQKDVLPPEFLRSISRTFHNQYGFSAGHLSGELRALEAVARHEAIANQAQHMIHILGETEADVATTEYRVASADELLQDTEQILQLATDWMQRMGKA